MHTPHPPLGNNTLKKWTCRESNPGPGKSTANLYMLRQGLNLGGVSDPAQTSHSPEPLSQKRWVEAVTALPAGTLRLAGVCQRGDL